MDKEDSIDAAAGVVDDVEAAEETKEVPDRTKEIISGLQDQIVKVNEKVDSGETKYNTMKSERDESVANISKIIGFVEGTGMGKYDPTTGEITRIESKQTGPDPIEVIQSQIDQSQKELNKQLKSGDITQAEFYEELQETIQPLKEQKRDLIYDKKMNKEISRVEEKFKTKDAPVDTKEITQENKVGDAYSKLVNEYPDVQDGESALYKKMNSLFVDNPDLYGNANQAGGKGDPTQYSHLIRHSILELKSEGIDIGKEKAATRNKYATPPNRGYQAPAKESPDLTTEEVNMLVSTGIKSKSLLKDINTRMGKYAETGVLEMDD